MTKVDHAVVPVRMYLVNKKRYSQERILTSAPGLAEDELRDQAGWVYQLLDHEQLRIIVFSQPYPITHI
jgi:hypothetical protein